MTTRKKRSTPKRTKADWGNIEQKSKAFIAIMREILDDPGLGDKYLKSDEAARQAFEDHGMSVPHDVKVVFLPPGDSRKLTAASAVIELPQVDPTNPKPTDSELAELVVANYPIIW